MIENKKLQPTQFEWQMFISMNFLGLPSIAYFSYKESGIYAVFPFTAILFLTFVTMFTFYLQFKDYFEVEI